MLLCVWNCHTERNGSFRFPADVPVYDWALMRLRGAILRTNGGWGFLPIPMGDVTLATYTVQTYSRLLFFFLLYLPLDFPAIPFRLPTLRRVAWFSLFKYPMLLFYFIFIYLYYINNYKNIILFYFHF